ncbi:putative F-box/LRR-repeat protein At3g18150 isoform X3 [Syzygium oleosum]|uniref:putative F-box/LRR-repeat protein At3g18150 isoform X3 n=1 Tax=Syzygium oleosum TaxID=219896 RepID=UPI0024B9CA68|nr:putative F-box/LRR-repeat protein At3g18150 isoform X3 [Syzygium oleosum]
MAETSVRRESSGGNRGNRAKGSRPPPPPPPMSPRDLISDLPDAVIHHIFSFLSLRDVVKTGVLSKRWRSTWTTTAQLVFDEAYSSDFPSLVDSVLIRCTSPAVKRFHIIRFTYDKLLRSKLDLWLRFAEERRVEDLRLCLHQPKVHYKLPRFLYCLSRLVRLEVRGCCFSLGTAVRWPCLKVLSIRYAEMSDDILEGIVRGSPVLESLELHNCRSIKNIVIDSTSVKELILDNGWLSNFEKIWAPHLLSLRVLGVWRLHSVFRLDDVSSLVEAELDFSVSGDGIGHDLLKELLEKLCGVSTITIGGWCLQVLSTLEMEGVSSPLSKCQNLILRTPVGQCELLGIAYILRSSQCLEKLVIHLTRSCVSKLKLDEESIQRFNFHEDLLCSRKGNFQCLAKHLKSVEIIDFACGFESKHLLALIKFLVGDALALEKMIIKANLRAQHVQKLVRVADICQLHGVSRNVLSYRRASQNAEVIFDYPLEEVSFEKHLRKILNSKRG